MEGAQETILRACLSRTSSGMSRRTALGRNFSGSRHRRLEKTVLSAVGPCLTTAMVLPSGRATAASMGMALYQRKRMGNAMLERAEERRYTTATASRSSPSAPAVPDPIPGR